MTPLLAPAVGTGHIPTKSDQYCLYSKLTDDRVEWCTCQSWTWYGYLPARGLSQYARNVRKFVRMRRLLAISLPRTYINCWSELGGHLVHSTPPDRPREPHQTFWGTT